MSTYLLGLSAAVCFGIAAVIQQRVAFRAPPGDVLRLRLLWWLVRRPTWVFGVAIGGVGSLLSAAALTSGAVALVEPLQICQLLFALPLAALLARRVVPQRDWTAAAATAVGLALFVVAGRPDSGDVDHATSGGWLATMLVVAVVMVACLWGTRGLPAVRRAPILAGAAGLLSALQAALVSGAGQLLTSGGIGALARSWFPWIIVAAAVISALLAQSAYGMAPLPASLPASVSVEPLAGVAIGVVLLGGGLRLTPWAVAGELVGLAVMTFGVRSLARSPLITGQISRLAARQAQGRLSRLEEQVHHDLERLRHDLRRSREAGPSGPAVRRLRRRLVRDLDRICEELASLADERDRFEEQLRPVRRRPRPVSVARSARRSTDRPLASVGGRPAGGGPASTRPSSSARSLSVARGPSTRDEIPAHISARSRPAPSTAAVPPPARPAALPPARPAGARATTHGPSAGGGPAAVPGPAASDQRSALGDDGIALEGLLAARRELDARAEELRRQAERLGRATRRVLAQNGLT
ncbi:Multidrug transporter [Frankia sp. AiPs1]|uniref:DMT family transporter n=1 Tax=Frankia sp. AiPa1 TaxID=573492 RepID=UPI00202B3A1D|nr:DMT family transporter [Frankia sp. AiPa1]MCL9759956.1 DMT family transporter [Frankia sp. AiPa1]